MSAFTAPTARRVLFSLAVLVMSLLAFAPTASAERLSFQAKRLKGQTAVFRVAGVDAAQVRRAKINVGRFQRRIRTSQMRRAAARGRLSVRLPRKVAKRLRKGATTSARRRRPRLTVVTEAPVVKPTGPVNGPVINFEGGNLSEAADSSTLLGSLGVIGSRAYEGIKSARATYNGGGSFGFQRVWQDVDWNAGSDVWYGMALYVPDNSDYCYWNPLRWDNHATYGGNGDVGGLAIDRGNVRIIQNNYGGREKTLVDGGKLPEGRWVWLELHQKFSKNDGQALSELYVDGRRAGSSTQANSMGRVINNLRAGVVNVAGECSRPASVDFDRVSISDGMRGPVS